MTEDSDYIFLRDAAGKKLSEELKDKKAAVIALQTGELEFDMKFFGVTPSFNFSISASGSPFTFAA